MILITGAFGGIGMALLERLKNSFVIASGREVHPLSTGNVEVVKCDVSSPDDVKNLFHIVEKANPSFLAVAHLAGVEGSALLPACPVEKIRKTIETNLLGSIYVAKCASSLLLKLRRKRRNFSVRLVFAGSTAWRSGKAGQTVYAATKAALLGLASVLNREMGERGMSSVVLAFGPVDTPMLAPYRNHFEPDSIMTAAEAAEVLKEFLFSCVEAPEFPVYEVRKERGKVVVRRLAVEGYPCGETGYSEEDSTGICQK